MPFGPRIGVPIVGAGMPEYRGLPKLDEIGERLCRKPALNWRMNTPY
jgi:hypothetical protein